MGLLTALGLRRSNQFERPTLIDHFLTSPLAYAAALLYHMLLLLRGRPLQPPRGRAPIRVVCVSDTHDQTVAVPDGDLLIHAGDLTNAGTAADIQRQLDWLRHQPHPVKIVVAGNHDSWFDERSRPEEDARSGAKVDLTGLIYLEGGLTVQEIKGRKIAIFGAPDIPECGPESFAFQYTDANQPWLSKVPRETDILITHTPPRHHLDLGGGCPHLLRELWRVRPRLHVFGHVHWAAGTEAAYFDEAQAAYERLQSRPPRGPLGDLLPGPAWLDALAVLTHGAHAVLWKWLMAGPGGGQGSLLVNAAQMYGDSGKVKSRAVVVDM